jgi:hypothetical protein
MTLQSVQPETMMIKYNHALNELEAGTPLLKAGITGGLIYCCAWPFMRIDPSNVSFYACTWCLINDCAQPIFAKIPYFSARTASCCCLAAAFTISIVITRAIGYSLNYTEAGCTILGLFVIEAVLAALAVLTDRTRSQR